MHSENIQKVMTYWLNLKESLEELIEKRTDTSISNSWLRPTSTFALRVRPLLIPPPWYKGDGVDGLPGPLGFVLLRQREIIIHWLDNPELALPDDTIFVSNDLT